MNDPLLDIANIKTEPDMKISSSLRKHVNDQSNERKEKSLFYMPLPNTLDDGVYVTQSDLVKLLRDNKDNPDAIQYLADMLE